MTKLEIKYTTQFKKDVKLAKKQHQNIDLLFEAIGKLADEKPLDEKYKDHELTGNYAEIRECHVEPDCNQDHCDEIRDYSKGLQDHMLQMDLHSDQTVV